MEDGRPFRLIAVFAKTGGTLTLHYLRLALQ